MWRTAMGSGCIACSLPAPEQHGTPMEDSMASEGWTDLFNQVLYESALTGSIRPHNDDEETRGPQPSANAPYSFEKRVGCQPQRISCKAGFPRVSRNLRDKRAQPLAGTCLDDAYIESAKKEFTCQPLRSGPAQLLNEVSQPALLPGRDCPFAGLLGQQVTKLRFGSGYP